MYIDKGTALGSGAVMTLMGIVLLVFPAFALSFFAVLVGLCFLVAGVAALVTWGRTGRGSSAGAFALVAGILGVVFGLACLFHPLDFAVAVTWLAALFVVVTGIAQLVTLVAAGGFPGRPGALVATVAFTVLGFCALANPTMVVQLIGLSFIVEGVTAIVLGLTAGPIDARPL